VRGRTTKAKTAPPAATTAAQTDRAPAEAVSDARFRSVGDHRVGARRRAPLPGGRPPVICPSAARAFAGRPAPCSQLASAAGLNARRTRPRLPPPEFPRAAPGYVVYRRADSPLPAGGPPGWRLLTARIHQARPDRHQHHQRPGRGPRTRCRSRGSEAMESLRPSVSGRRGLRSWCQTAGENGAVPRRGTTPMANGACGCRPQGSVSVHDREVRVISKMKPNSEELGRDQNWRR